MNQIVRRAIYLLAGAIPASLGVAFATFAEPWLIPAIAGAIGLLVASMVRFPVPLKGYGAIAILLIVGLSAAIPFGTTLLLLSLAAGVSAEMWPSLALIAWVFFGPILCATHFLWAARGAPNNSFKPRPLRGSA